MNGLDDSGSSVKPRGDGDVKFLEGADVKLRVEVQPRTISPYDLSSSDNPGSVIAQPLLLGPNYNEWAANVCMALKARKKFGFVDGTIPKPHEDSGDLEDWWTNNALVMSWLKLTVVDSVRSTLSHLEVASDLWNHIRKRYCVQNGQRVKRLKAELATCRQHGLTVEAYYGKLIHLWTSLAEFRQSKNCESPNSVELQREREEDRLHEFFKGLDESLFGSVKSSLLSRDPLPTVDEAYSVLMQEEDSKTTSQALELRNDAMAYVVQPAFSSGPGLSSTTREDRSHLVCSSCGRSGHSAENFFRTMGYPDWWRGRPRGRINSGRGRGNQAGCGSGPPLAAAPARVNSVAVNKVVTDADRVGLTSLNDTQWRTLVAMLNEWKASSSETLTGMCFLTFWIVDSGATNHMSGSVEFLCDIRNSAPLPVKLLDGRFTVATRRGTVILSDTFFLLYQHFKWQMLIEYRTGI